MFRISKKTRVQVSQFVRAAAEAFSFPEAEKNLSVKLFRSICNNLTDRHTDLTDPDNSSIFLGSRPIHPILAYHLIGWGIEVGLTDPGFHEFVLSCIERKVIGGLAKRKMRLDGNTIEEATSAAVNLLYGSDTVYIPVKIAKIENGKIQEVACRMRDAACIDGFRDTTRKMRMNCLVLKDGKRLEQVWIPASRKPEIELAIKIGRIVLVKDTGKGYFTALGPQYNMFYTACNVAVRQLVRMTIGTAPPKGKGKRLSILNDGIARAADESLFEDEFWILTETELVETIGPDLRPIELTILKDQIENMRIPHVERWDSIAMISAKIGWHPNHVRNVLAKIEEIAKREIFEYADDIKGTALTS